MDKKFSQKQEAVLKKKVIPDDVIIQLEMSAEDIRRGKIIKV